MSRTGARAGRGSPRPRVPGVVALLVAALALSASGCGPGGVPGDGQWAPAEQVAGPGPCCEAAAVVDSHGTVTVAWLPDGDGVRFRRQEPGEPWGPVEELTAPASGYTDAVALGVDAGGRVTAVWDQYLPSYQGYRLFASDHSPGGDWSTPTRLALRREEEAEFWRLRMAENAAGETVVVSEDDLGTILAVTRSGGEWHAAERLGYGSLPVATISPSGVATIAFETYSDGVKLWRHEGEDWSPAPDPPGPEGHEVALDAGPGDEAVVMWRSGKDSDPNNAYPPPKRKPSYTYATARYDGRWTGFTRLATRMGKDRKSVV